MELLQQLSPRVVIFSIQMKKRQLAIYIFLDVMDLDSVLSWILFICMNWFIKSDIWKNVMDEKNMHVSFLYISFTCQIS